LSRRQPIEADPAATTSDPYDCGMSHTVVAELVAAVMKVEVAVGDQVSADDEVVILESMKMEIPVLAEVPGRVAEIVVAEGDVVNDGDPLVVITPSAR
jgi:acetyl-CoA carboxylase biotin carboxyl carrier protein